jgi:hypothetical protein
MKKQEQLELFTLPIASGRDGTAMNAAHPLRSGAHRRVLSDAFAEGKWGSASTCIRILLGFGTSCTRYGKKLSPLFFVWKIICKTVQRSAFSWGVHKKQRAHVVFMGLANSATPGGDA